MSLDVRQPGEYTDADYDAAETAKANATITSADVLREVRALREDFAEVLKIAYAVKEQVEPTLDALSTNPMLKMFIGKRGRS